jgi:hypothetical protein
VVVTDIEAAREGLLERGVQVSEIRHKTPVGAWDGSFGRGPDADPGDYALRDSIAAAGCDRRSPQIEGAT